MPFCVTWEFTELSEAGTARSLQVVSQWRPPDEAELKGSFGFAESAGGVALIEIDGAETLQRVIAPWTSWLGFDTRAIIPIETSAAILLAENIDGPAMPGGSSPGDRFRPRESRAPRARPRPGATP